MKFAVRCLAAVLAVCCAAIWGLAGWMTQTLPDRYWVTQGNTLTPSPLVSGRADNEGDTVAAAQREAGSNYPLTLRLFDCIPLKGAVATVVNTPVVVPCGTPFGIKMYTDGVLIVGLTEVETASGLNNPAKKAGIRVGDVLLAIDGKPVNTIREVSDCIENCGGRVLEWRIRRSNLEFTVRFAPIKGTDKQYKAGLWIRDSSAGIGTMTFYDPETGLFGGLGHGVSDTDTGDILPISTGEVVPARIFNVVPGVSGQPGELCGTFEPGTLGTLLKNGDTGVVGTLLKKPSLRGAIPLALRQQVKKGPVLILTTLNGKEPDWYEAEIEQIRQNDGSQNRHLILHITDPALLSRTGGIVQGMSGSPIIQDGRLVGAVTHVFVNDPTHGYGIFAETMLRTLRETAEESAGQQNAS